MGAVDRLKELLWKASCAVLGAEGDPAPPPRLRTGTALDVPLGGGFPRGRIVELFGGPGMGKTTMSLQIAAGVQRAGATVAILDVEGSLDMARVRDVGVDLARTAIARPATGEQALQIVDALLRARAADLIVVDSVAALVPRAELLAPIGDAAPTLQARMMSAALRRLVWVAGEGGGVVLFLNQTRTAFDERGAPVQITAGGSALRFYASVRLELLRPGRIRIVKNRFGAEGVVVSCAPMVGAME